MARREVSLSRDRRAEWGVALTPKLAFRKTFFSKTLFLKSFFLITFFA